VIGRGGTAGGGDEAGEDREVIGRADRAGDGLVELLQAELLVHERAVLLELMQRRDDHLGRGTGGVGVGAAVHDGNLGELRGAEAGGGEVLAHGHDGLDLAGVDRGAEGGELRGRQRGDEAGDERAADVRVAVGGEEELVALPHPADQVRAGLERGGELLREELFLEGAATGADHGDGAGVGGKNALRGVDRHVDRAVGTIDFHHGEAVGGLDGLIERAAGVGHPRVVHRVVAARGDAVDDALAGPDDGVGADAGLGVDAVRLLEEPDAHLEAEVGAGERADGADVDRVERVVVLQLLARVARERAVAAAVDEAEDVVLGDLLAEADAARAEDAALVVEHDARPELGALRLHVLLLDEARVAATVAGGLLLEHAFARLVADRAVERVIDEEELHHALARVLHHLGRGADVHARGDVGAAADLRARDPVDLLLARGRIHDRRLGGRVDGGHAHLNQAHAAIAGDRELRMVAEVRHVDVHEARGLDHVGALRHGDLLAVDVDGDEVGFGGGDGHCENQMSGTAGAGFVGLAAA